MTRGSRIGASILTTLTLLTVGALGFRFVSPRTDSPTGYRTYLDRAGEPVVIVEAHNRIGPATRTIATDGVMGTVAALPTEVAKLLFLALDTDELNSDLQVERSLSTRVDSNGSIVATVELRLLRPVGYDTAVAFGSHDPALVYAPARTELPAEVAPGQSWSSTGIENGDMPFTYRGAITAAERRDGRQCVRIDTVLDSGPLGAQSRSRTSRSIRCDGLGSVEWGTTEDGTRFSLAAPGSVSLGPVIAPAPEAVGGGATLPSSFPNSELFSQPVVIAGLVVSANASLGDIHAVHPMPDGQQVVWVQHPGGEILGMAADDSLIYVTTTRRQLMAFDAAGRIHWLTRLPDAAVGTPARSGSVVVVALLDGSVRAFDRDSGASRWTTRLDDTIAASPVVTDGQIITADISGLITATRADGASAWSASVGPVRAPMTARPGGGVLAQDADGTLHALDSSGGETWASDLSDTVTGRGSVIGDVVVLPAGSALLGIRLRDGSPVWRVDTPGPAEVAPDGAFAAGLLTGRVSAGGLVDRVYRQGEGSPRSWPLVVGRQHLVIDASGAITAVGDG